MKDLCWRIHKSSNNGIFLLAFRDQSPFIFSYLLRVQLIHRQCLTVKNFSNNQVIQNIFTCNPQTTQQHKQVKLFLSITRFCLKQFFSQISKLTYLVNMKLKFEEFRAGIKQNIQASPLREKASELLDNQTAMVNMPQN